MVFFFLGGGGFGTYMSQYFFVPGAGGVEAWSSGNSQTATFCRTFSEW